VNILVVSQWFPPEPGGGPARFLEMATLWQAGGNEVTILAGIPNWPTGRVAQGYERKLLVRERYAGLRVVRSWVFATPNEGVVKRIANHASFLASAPLASLFATRRPDVVVATSPPLFAALAGLGIATRFGVPLVLDIRDLWPDAIFALGQVRQPAARWLLRSVERLLYRQAAAVVAVSPQFRQPILARGAAAVEVIPNGADLQFFCPGRPDTELRRALGWDGKFVVLYAGTIGMAHGLRTMLDAADLSRDTPVHFALAGEGAERARLEAEAVHRGLANVQFLPLQPRERMPALYLASDVCLVTLRPISLFERFIPSKIFEIMACGRPLIAAVAGEARDVVQAAGAGVPVEPGSGARLAEGVRQAMNSDALEQMGASGRSFVEENYDRAEMAQRYLRVLRTARWPAGRGRHQPPTMGGMAPDSPPRHM
jgi:glycosyltransferase involved in cell wall biosynthesis